MKQIDTFSLVRASIKASVELRTVNVQKLRLVRFYGKFLCLGRNNSSEVSRHQQFNRFLQVAAKLFLKYCI